MLLASLAPATVSPAESSEAKALVRVAREFGALGWTPATSGNYSIRLGENRLLLTRSGVHKRDLSLDDLMLVDDQGRPVEAGRASAETGLHVQLYQLDPAINAVLHVHSPAATVASRRYARAGEIVFRNYELQKALAGIHSHETEVRIPVVANDQDIDRLAASIQPHLDRTPRPWGYLIEGHGIYAWGGSVAEAARHLEALDFLLACDLMENRGVLS
ncbi:MAG: methylthioribulose 1-phosphate dehydratase [Wenzhouxiangella sp.]